MDLFTLVSVSFYEDEHIQFVDIKLIHRNWVTELDSETDIFRIRIGRMIFNGINLFVTVSSQCVVSIVK